VSGVSLSVNAINPVSEQDFALFILAYFLGIVSSAVISLTIENP